MIIISSSRENTGFSEGDCQDIRGFLQPVFEYKIA